MLDVREVGVKPQHNFERLIYILDIHIKSTVDRHKLNHLATYSTTFAAFSRPLYCM